VFQEVVMRMATHCPLLITLLSVILTSTAPALAVAQAQAGSGRGRVVLPAQEGERIPAGARLVDVIRSRLPLVVVPGRFSTVEGSTDVCVATERSRSRARSRAGNETRFPECELMVVLLNGNRISDPASFLLSAPVHDFESIELVRAADALGRYGISTAGTDVLELWSVGRGPYVKSRF
jgi:hypothetical protein